jgi:plastocyanin
VIGARSRRLVAVGAGIVLLVAGCGGGGDSGSTPYKQPAGPAERTIKIDAGNFYFDPDKITVKPGISELDLVLDEGNHTLVFDDNKVPGFQLEVAGDTKTDAKKVDLKPGTYTFYCDILGHREQGMEGTITVK